MNKVTVEHSKEEQLIIYLKKVSLKVIQNLNIECKKLCFGEITIITQRLEFILIA